MFLKDVLFVQRSHDLGVPRGDMSQVDGHKKGRAGWDPAKELYFLERLVEPIQLKVQGASRRMHGMLYQPISTSKLASQQHS